MIEEEAVNVLRNSLRPKCDWCKPFDVEMKFDNFHIENGIVCVYYLCPNCNALIMIKAEQNKEIKL